MSDFLEPSIGDIILFTPCDWACGIFDETMLYLGVSVHEMSEVKGRFAMSTPPQGACIMLGRCGMLHWLYPSSLNMRVATIVNMNV